MGGGAGGVIQIRIRAAQGSFLPGIRGNVPFSLFLFSNIISPIRSVAGVLSARRNNAHVSIPPPTPRPHPRLRRASEAERKDEACAGS